MLLIKEREKKISLKKQFQANIHEIHAIFPSNLFFHIFPHTSHKMY